MRPSSIRKALPNHLWRGDLWFHKWWSTLRNTLTVIKLSPFISSWYLTVSLFILLLKRWESPGSPKRHFCKNKWIAKSILNYHVLLDTLIKHMCLKSTFSSETMQAPKRYLWWENGKVPINMVNTLTLMGEKLYHYSAHLLTTCLYSNLQLVICFFFFLMKAIQTCNTNHISRLDVAPELYL